MEEGPGEHPVALAAMPSANPVDGSGGDPDKKDAKLPEFEPPQACVQRIIKSALPDNCQITKESKAAFSKAAGIFIIYLTTCANDFCKENKRSTISSADVMSAMRELEFHDLMGPLEEFLTNYRKDASTKKDGVAAATVASAPAADAELPGKKSDKAAADDGEDDEEEIHESAEMEVEAELEENGQSVADTPVAPAET